MQIFHLKCEKCVCPFSQIILSCTLKINIKMHKNIFKLPTLLYYLNNIKKMTLLLRFIQNVSLKFKLYRKKHILIFKNFK